MRREKSRTSCMKSSILRTALAPAVHRLGLDLVELARRDGLALGNDIRHGILPGIEPGLHLRAVDDVAGRVVGQPLDDLVRSGAVAGIEKDAVCVLPRLARHEMTDDQALDGRAPPAAGALLTDHSSFGVRQPPLALVSMAAPRKRDSRTQRSDVSRQARYRRRSDGGGTAGSTCRNEGLGCCFRSAPPCRRS